MPRLFTDRIPFFFSFLLTMEIYERVKIHNEYGNQELIKRSCSRLHHEFCRNMESNIRLEVEMARQQSGTLKLVLRIERGLNREEAGSVDKKFEIHRFPNFSIAQCWKQHYVSSITFKIETEYECTALFRGRS